MSCFLEVMGAEVDGIVDTAEVEIGAVMIDGDVLIEEKGESRSFKLRDDLRGVVVPRDGIDRRIYGFQDGLQKVSCFICRIESVL